MSHTWTYRAYIICKTDIPQLPPSALRQILFPFVTFPLHIYYWTQRWNDELSKQIVCCQRKVLNTMDLVQTVWHILPGSVKGENLTALEIPSLQRRGIAIACMDGREFCCKSSCQTGVLVTCGQQALNAGVPPMRGKVTTCQMPVICHAICWADNCWQCWGTALRRRMGHSWTRWLCGKDRSILLDKGPACAVMRRADGTCGWVGSSSVDNKGVVYSPNVHRAGSQKLCMGRGNKQHEEIMWRSGEANSRSWQEGERVEKVERWGGGRRKTQVCFLFWWRLTLGAFTDLTISRRTVETLTAGWD